MFLQMILLCATVFADDSRARGDNNSIANKNEVQDDEPPKGYYAFVQSPNAEPPKVKPPPYIDSDKECHGNFNI